MPQTGIVPWSTPLLSVKVSDIRPSRALVKSTERIEPANVARPSPVWPSAEVSVNEYASPFLVKCQVPPEVIQVPATGSLSCVLGEAGPGTGTDTGEAGAGQTGMGIAGADHRFRNSCRICGGKPGT